MMSLSNNEWYTKVVFTLAFLYYPVMLRERFGVRDDVFFFFRY